MNRIDQIVAIGTYQRWTELRVVLGDVKGIPPNEWKGDVSLSGEAWLPDYMSDLNEIHEVVKQQDEYTRRRFRHNLGVLCCQNNWGDPIDATAAQRCEAFLKTINKWKP